MGSEWVNPRDSNAFCVLIGTSKHGSRNRNSAILNFSTLVTLLRERNESARIFIESPAPYSSNRRYQPRDTLFTAS